MAVDLDLSPKQKRPAGEPCCEPVVYPDVERDQAVRMATVAKALGDPVRLQLVDVLRKHAGEVCVCELVPLFDIAQPTLSHYFKKLREAGNCRLRVRSSCGSAAAGGSCGCSVGAPEQSADAIRETVRERYTTAALAAREQGSSCGCGDGGRIWRPAMGRAKSDFTLYDLRRTFASRLLSAGIPLVEVSAWMGHRDRAGGVGSDGGLV